MAGKKIREQATNEKNVTKFSVEHLLHQTYIAETHNISNLIAEYKKHLENIGPGMTYYELRESGDFYESMADRLAVLSKALRSKADTLGMKEEEAKEAEKEEKEKDD